MIYYFLFCTKLYLITFNVQPTHKGKTNFVNRWPWKKRWSIILLHPNFIYHLSLSPWKRLNKNIKPPHKGMQKKCPKIVKSTNFSASLLVKAKKSKIWFIIFYHLNSSTLAIVFLFLNTEWSSIFLLFLFHDLIYFAKTLGYIFTINLYSPPKSIIILFLVLLSHLDKNALNLHQFIILFFFAIFLRYLFPLFLQHKISHPINVCFPWTHQ